MTTKELIDKRLAETSVHVLVFGPAVAPVSSDPHVAGMQKKRAEIKLRLLAAGHHAQFGEEVYDPSLPVSDPLTQEVAAMGVADLIVVLVASPGAIGEAMKIASHKELCPKTDFYCFDDHKDGLVVKHLLYIGTLGSGSNCELVSLASVNACHLTGAVVARVERARIAKAFLF